MSYDVGVRYERCDACGREAGEQEALNYTSNMAPAWREAGAQIHDWNDRPVSDCMAELERAIRNVTARPEEFVRFEPGNGWGDVETMLRWLREIRAMFEAHPRAKVTVSR